MKVPYTVKNVPGDLIKPYLAGYADLGLVIEQFDTYDQAEACAISESLDEDRIWCVWHNEGTNGEPNYRFAVLIFRGTIYIPK